MSEYKSLAELIKLKFPGMSQRRIAALLGVDNTTVFRWMSNKDGQPTSMDKCLRLARACDVDPREVFELAGRLDEFGPLLDFYGGRITTLQELFAGDPPKGSLLMRAERLMKRGWQGQLEAKLGELESFWEIHRQGFKTLAEGRGDAAFLMLQHSRIGNDILYLWNCREEEAGEISATAGAPEWKSFRHSGEGLNVVLYLRRASVGEESGEIEVMLASWWATFKSLLDAE